MKTLSNAILILIFGCTCITGMAQQPFYDISVGNGNGIRFWSNDLFKIHMGSGAGYTYGPVTDYALKTNMSNDAGRGWTWGVSGLTPVAAIGIQGNMQIAGNFTVGGNIVLPNVLGNTQIFTWNGGDTNWRIGMSSAPGFTRSLTTSHVQYISYHTDMGQGLAVGVNGGQSSFEIQGRDHRAFFRGNVGVGTADPQTALSVSGPQEDQLHLSRATANAGDNIYMVFSHSGSTAPANARARIGVNIKNGGAGRLVFQTGPGGATEQMRIDENGNIGIGTTSPNKKLTVNGTIYGKEVEIDLNVPGPDYVFEKDYALPSLEEIKSYIDEHKHLPEVPSAKEMEANGINVGEMNMILLKKVEELTLYLLEANKKIEDLDSEVQKLKGKSRE